MKLQEEIANLTWPHENKHSPRILHSRLTEGIANYDFLFLQCKILPMKILLTSLAAPGSPRMVHTKTKNLNYLAATCKTFITFAGFFDPPVKRINSVDCKTYLSLAPSF